MFDSTPAWIDVLWRGALAATIPAIIIAFVSRFLSLRPPTRHALWLMVLSWFVIAPLLPSAPHGKIASFLSSKSQGTTETQNSPRPEEKKNHSVPLSLCVESRPQNDSIHARTGPTVPNRLARAPRPVGHGLARIETPLPRIDFDSDRPPVSGEKTPPEESVCVAKSRPPSATLGTTSLSRFELPRNQKKTRSTRSGFNEERPGPIRRASDAPTNRPIDTPSATAIWIDACRAALGSVKDALARIPALPPVAWFAGIALILLARGLAYTRYARCVRTARRAPSSIQRMVRRSARDIGLSPAPKVSMIDGRFSPMVSFIGKRRLLLPTELWSQLDEPGRQAIIYHELAHLRRRDDWVRWFENLVNCLYWWHPVVWWLCGRLREEAENCCDAWVTWLMPKGRRAYAEALLTTSRYVGSSSTALPGVGIGATSVRASLGSAAAERFARRLTMVMTNPSRPRMSLPGAALTAALALAGWLATPAWSSPTIPDRLDHSKPMPAPPAPVTVATPVAPEAPVAIPSPSPSTVTMASPAAPLTPPALFDAIGTTVAKSLLSATEYPPRQRRSSNDGDLEARMERLERKLEELTERLAAGPPTPRPPVVVEMPGQPAPANVFVRRSPRAPQADGPKEWRHYELPQGKLEAIIALMSRQDVPVLIRSQGGGIDVEGTPQQQAAFEAFVRLINPSQGDAAPSDRRARRAVRSRAPRAARAAGQGRASADVRQEADEARALVEAKEQELEALEAQKEKIQELAETLHERADTIKENAEDLKDMARSEALKQVAELVEQAKSMAEKTKSIDQSVAKLAEELSRLESDADQLDDRADADDDDDGEDDADDEDEASAAIELDQAMKEHAKTHVIQREKVKMKEKDKDRANALHKADELFTRHQWTEAAAEYQKFIETHADDGRAWYNLGYSYHMNKQFDPAMKAFQRAVELETREGDSLYNIACGYSLRGDADQAFKWLQKAVDAGYADTNNMKGDSDLNNIRHDARYKKLIEELGDSGGV